MPSKAHSAYCRSQYVPCMEKIEGNCFVKLMACEAKGSKRLQTTVSKKLHQCRGKNLKGERCNNYIYFSKYCWRHAP